MSRAVCAVDNTSARLGFTRFLTASFIQPAERWVIAPGTETQSGESIGLIRSGRPGMSDNGNGKNSRVNLLQRFFQRNMHFKSRTPASSCDVSAFRITNFSFQRGYGDGYPTVRWRDSQSRRQ